MFSRTKKILSIAQLQLGVFVKTLTSGGNLVITCAALSLFLANSVLGKQFVGFWHHEVSIPYFPKVFSIEEFVNDVLMSFFFLLVGLEIKSELLVGALSDLKKASLPLAGAIGGMLVPAVVYHFFNHDTTLAHGWAIPMATDIAFALAILNLLKGRVHQNLLILLTTLAVADDLGAVVVIALFYTASISLWAIGGMVATLAVLSYLNHKQVNSYWWYILFGIVLWIFTALSGIHATVAGVLLAFTIPISSDIKAPFNRLVDFLEEPVNYLILPIFALCNTAVQLRPQYINELGSPLALGIILGLLVGKMMGIFSFSYISSLLKIGQLPAFVNWKQILGISMLGGIGFTMSIFVTLLAFDDYTQIEAAKLYIIIGSFTSAIVGLTYLRFVSDPVAKSSE
jgi:NhaA family Na+:H+ antiporter